MTNSRIISVVVFVLLISGCGGSGVPDQSTLDTKLPEFLVGSRADAVSLSDSVKTDGQLAENGLDYRMEVTTTVIVEAGCISVETWYGESAPPLSLEAIRPTSGNNCPRRANGSNPIYQAPYYRLGRGYTRTVPGFASFTKRESGWVLLDIALDRKAVVAIDESAFAQQVTEGMRLASGSKMAVAETFLETGRLPQNRRDAGMSANARDTSGKYTSSVEVRQGTIIVTYGNDADSSFNGDKIGIQPFGTADDSISWVCGKAAPGPGLYAMPNSVAAASVTTIKDSLLPDECR